MKIFPSTMKSCSLPWHLGEKKKKTHYKQKLLTKSLMIWQRCLRIVFLKFEDMQSCSIRRDWEEWRVSWEGHRIDTCWVTASSELIFLLCLRNTINTNDSSLGCETIKTSIRKLTYLLSLGVVEERSRGILYLCWWSSQQWSIIIEWKWRNRTLVCPLDHIHCAQVQCIKYQDIT